MNRYNRKFIGLLSSLLVVGVIFAALAYAASSTPFTGIRIGRDGLVSTSATNTMGTAAITNLSVSNVTKIGTDVITNWNADTVDGKNPGSANGLATLGAGSLLAQNAPSGFAIGGNTAWHAGNDGAGSGLDADKIKGWTVYWAEVSQSGILANNVGVTASSKIATGQYSVTFPAFSSGTSYIAVCTPGGLVAGGAIAWARSSSTTLYVYTYNTSHAAADNSFSVLLLGN